MCVCFLIGMHLVRSVDKAVAVQLFNEISDFSVKARDSDNWAMDEYEYIRDNINNENVYVDKINILIVPEMVVETINARV